MEDLRPHGYSRVSGLDDSFGLPLGHALAALDELAKFHAFAHAWMNREGREAVAKEYACMMADNFYAEPNDGARNMLKAFDATMIQFAEMVQEPGQDLAAALREFNDRVGFEKQREECYSPNEGGFNVICHGDASFNIILFK